MTIAEFTSLSLKVNITAGWTDITSYHVAPITGRDGFSGTKWTDRVAPGGQLTIRLDNSGGQFTVGGASVLAGFKKGVPIKLDVVYDGVTTNVFYGFVDELKTDIHPPPYVTLTCITWLGLAARMPLRKTLQSVTNSAIQEVVAA